MSWEVNNDGFWEQMRVGKTTLPWEKNKPMESDWRLAIFFIGFSLGILVGLFCK